MLISPMLLPVGVVLGMPRPLSSMSICNQRAVALMHTKARLACSLDHLVCNSGPAPGDSCLADAFLMQGASDASLRLSWLDHFGVRATERREPLGASTTFSRRATRITGNWAGTKMALRYRAGVTYVGRITLADGRSETIQCNDLSMFD